MKWNNRGECGAMDCFSYILSQWYWISRKEQPLIYTASHALVCPSPIWDVWLMVHSVSLQRGSQGCIGLLGKYNLVLAEAWVPTCTSSCLVNEHSEQKSSLLSLPSLPSSSSLPFSSFKSWVPRGQETHAWRAAESSSLAEKEQA